MLNQVFEFLHPLREQRRSSVKILDNHVSLFEALFVSEVVHEIEQCCFSAAINERIFTFGKLLIQFSVLRTFLKNVIKHVHIVSVDSLVSQHVNDRNGKDKK